jgi:hypothetical protein
MAPRKAGQASDYLRPNARNDGEKHGTAYATPQTRHQEESMMPDDPKAKRDDKYRRWVKEVYEPWYAALTDSGGNSPPPSPPPGG